MIATTSHASTRADEIDEPRALPLCRYPGAADTHRHGVQVLPARLPYVDFARVAAYRSSVHRTVALTHLPAESVLAVARVTASAFARREPQCRHLRPARERPATLDGALHRDALGTSAFGIWDMETILFWFVRTLILTDPTSPRDAIRTSDAALAQSLAIADPTRGTILGAALNETLVAHDAPPALRTDDPFLDAVLQSIAPVLELLSGQDADALAALCAAYPEFARALEHGRVGHHFMVARADALPTRDAFELVAATAAHYRELGFAYVIVEATNQWTGAACELLNGVRVHYAPFRARRVVATCAAAGPGEVWSPDGYLAAKDSGSMLYVLRVA